MNRRDFLKVGAGSLACAAAGCATGREPGGYETETANKLAALKKLPTLLPDAVVRDGRLKGRNACKYVDDCIWFLRDLARKRPKSAFDLPFLAGFRKVHEATGLKVQFNLFYRTDFFYGMDEFTLKEVPDAYRDEFQANADWIKFGFHSLQEFPDYPWLNASYGDVAKCLQMIRGEVARFAGDNLFARALIPHWVPMSKDGVRALADGGIRIMFSDDGARYAYPDDPEVLPYGHSFRLEQDRKPETALYLRGSYLSALAVSLCGYNHLDAEQDRAVARSNRYVYDPATRMCFRPFVTNPMSCINVHTIPQLRERLDQLKDAEFIGYGNHEQYFYRDYIAHQPEYMEKEMLCAQTLKSRGYSFVFMEDLV